MPRKSKGPRLALDSRGNWIIRDGRKNRGTGCNEHDRETAETKLAEYILKKHDPEKAVREGKPNAVKIADVLTLDMHRIEKSDMPVARKKELISNLQLIGNWFGNRIVDDLTGALQ